MIRLSALAVVMLLPLSATAQVVAPAPAPAAAPFEHRLTAAEIAAAQADGDARNRAAELLAMTRGEPSLALPGEKAKKWHGTAEVAILEQLHLRLQLVAFRNLVDQKTGNLRSAGIQSGASNLRAGLGRAVFLPDEKAALRFEGKARLGLVAIERRGQRRFVSLRNCHRLTPNDDWKCHGNDRQEQTLANRQQ